MARYLGVPLLAAALLLAGCQSLPDTQPFTDATISLRSAVGTSGKAALTELKALKFKESDERARLREQVKQLEAAWKTRENVMKAMSDYATSLQAIVDAGKKGEESVKQLTGAAQTFLGAVGAAGMTGPAAALVGDAVNFAGGFVIRAQAAKSLEQAMVDLQPAITRTAELMAADALDLRGMLDLCYEQQERMLDDEDENAASLAFWSSLQRERNDVIREVRTKLDDKKLADEAGKAALARLAQLDELIAGLKPWRESYVAKVAHIREQQRLSSALMDEMQAGFGVWAATHHKLHVAVQTKRPPTTAELTDTAKRIHDLIERFRQL